MANEISPATGLADWARRLSRARRARVYGLAIAGAVVVLLLVALLRAALPAGAAYLLYMPVVVAASFFGGAGPGVLTTVLCVAAGMLLAPGGVQDATPVLFVVLGLFASAGGELALRARQRGEQAARALADREALLQSIFNAAPDAMIVIDESRIIQSYSAAAERMFGWSAGEAIGRNVSLLMPQPYRDEHDDYVERYLATGEKRIIGIGRIVVGERKGGAAFPIELAVGEVRSKQGRFFTGFIRDLTERQETEARLQELQSELVHVLRLSTMGEMASALAHELNQPLSAIANYLSGARRLMEKVQGQDDRATEAVGKAADQALRAGEIIRRLRDFLARGEGERGIESLPRLTQEACALALVGARDHGVSVQYRFDPRADRVLADRVQIQQVIVNLVRNALDAMSDHAGARELLVSSSFGDDGMALVSVIDTGPGLEEAVAARLFQPFVTTKPQGMGVGLSISRTIVEAHGGRIWSEPNPKGGAVFRFNLPLARENDDGEASA